MSKTRFAFPAALAAAISVVVLAGPAAAAPNDQPCTGPTDPGATYTCTAIVRASAEGPLGSPAVTDCLGEDFYLSIDALVLEHVVVHPGGELLSADSLTSAHTTVHGSGYGLTTGTKTEFDETGSQVFDFLPNGDEVLHTTSSASVPTQGSTPNLELTIEAEIHTDAFGNTTFSEITVQEGCGTEHDVEHLQG